MRPQASPPFALALLSLAGVCATSCRKPSPTSTEVAAVDAGSDAATLAMPDLVRKANAVAKDDGVKSAAWPGWPLPKGTIMTPALFCQGTLGAQLHVHDPKCSAAELAEDAPGLEILPPQERNCIAHLNASVANKRVTLNSEAGERCLAANVAEALKRGSNDPRLTKACNGVIVGLQPQGAACRDTWECGASLSCVGYTSDTDGKCEPLGAAGAPCGQKTEGMRFNLDVGDRGECARGARCSFNTCKALKKRGEACQADEQCLEDLACRAGVCGAPDRLAASRPCDAMGDDCNDGLYCAGARAARAQANAQAGAQAGASSTCMPKKPAGAACTEDLECRGHCKTGPAKSGVCVSWCKSG